MYEFIKESEQPALPSSRSADIVEYVYEYLKEIERRKLSSLRSAHNTECVYKFFKQISWTSSCTLIR